jgi:xanthine dehydrogenase accessory factor
MTIREVLPELKKWTHAGESCGIAMLYQVQHSSPRPVGSCLAVSANGAMAGAVSMGCVESDLREHIQEMLRDSSPPRLLHYGAADDMLVEVGLTCGGEIDVLVMPFDATNPAWNFLVERGDDTTCLLATVIDGEGAGEVVCMTEDGHQTGGLDDPEIAQLVAEQAPSFFAQKRSRCLKTSAGHRVFIQVIVPAPKLAIIGGSPIAEALCYLASRTGYEITVIDPRRVVAPAEYYPQAKTVIHEWPEAGMQQAGVGPDWFVAVLSHDPKLDVPALDYALRTDCFYVGLLGSRGTQKKRIEALQQRGVSASMIERIHGPIGYKELGAVTSPEIAVSILAEMIACQHKKMSLGHSEAIGRGGWGYDNGSGSQANLNS